MKLAAPITQSLSFTALGAQPADPLTGQGPDCTPALNAAAQLGGVLDIPAGKWRFASAPAPIGRTLLIRGAGVMHPGERGTVLIADYSGADFLVWDAHAPNLAGGSGVEGCVIYKGRNQKGGCALKFTTSAPANREGWIQLDRVVVGGYAYSGDTPSTWDQCLVLDGTRTPVPPGLRDGWITRSAFSAAQAGPAVQLMGATGLFVSGVEVLPGSGSNGDLMLSGTQAVPSQGCHLDGVSVMGRLIIGYGTLFTCRGFAQGVQVMNVASNGLVDVVGVTGPVLGGEGRARKDGQAGVWVRVGQ